METNQIDFNLDSYCGIYCGACDIMISYKTGKKQRLASVWNENTVKLLHKGLGLKYDESKPFTQECHGCKSGQLFVNCSVCKKRECAISRNVAHCIDCTDYPCDEIRAMQKNASVLPHAKANHANMEAIKTVGVRQWLSDQQNRWKCPKCNMSFSWYSSACNSCGTDLRKYTYRFSFIQFLLLRFGIYMISRRQKFPVVKAGR